jgi:hypothetical protein
MTLKLLENAMRIFEKNLSKPQMWALRTIMRWIFKHTTTIISQLHEHKDIQTKKFLEKHSYHLWNMDLIETIEDKALRIVKNNIIDEKTKLVFVSTDESDIFKPDAKKMPWLTRIRDWSTWLTGNWYVFRWVNINWISLYSELDVINESDESYEKKTKTEKTIVLMKKTWKILSQIKTKAETYFLYDRAWDDIKVIDHLLEQSWTHFVIRMKKNRILKDVTTWISKKITQFWVGKYFVEIKWGTSVYLHVIKKKEEREPIYLITNNEKLDSKIVLEYYLKRWKIEEDFNKMKDLWLEEVRLMSIKKIQNLVAIIQFIIVLSQDVFNEVMEKRTIVMEHIYLYFVKFCKWKTLTLNPQSFIKFISQGLTVYKSYNTNLEPMDTLFWWLREMKKMGII